MRTTKLFLVLITCFVVFSTIVQAEELTINVGGVERDLILKYPKNSANIPVPLVMIFHGGGGNSSWMQRKSSELSELLLNAGYSVAFMNGTGRLLKMNTWNAEHCCGYAAEHKIDEVAYIDAAIDLIAEKYLVDERNIFFIGHSNGGMISYRAAGETRHAIKGIVVVSSAIFADQAIPKRPFSLFMMQTKDDEVVPFAGGMSTNKKALRTQMQPYVAFEDSVNLWKKYLRCGQESQKSVADNVLMHSANCESGNFIRVLELTKGGHKWNKEVGGVSLPQEILLFMQDAVRTVPN